MSGTLVTQNNRLCGYSALYQGVITVTAAGTAERLSADQACHECTVIALPTNTDYVYIGTSSVSSSMFAVTLAPGDSFTFSVDNVNLLYVDAAISSEGVSYAAL